MIILSTFINDFGGDFLLVQYEGDHFSYGARKDFNTICGVPIQQCGTRKELLNRLENLIELKNNHILEYKKQFNKDNHIGWNVLINESNNKIKMFQQFIDSLNSIKTD